MGEGSSKDRKKNKLVCALIEGGMVEDCDSCDLKEICIRLDDVVGKIRNKNSNVIEDFTL